MKSMGEFRSVQYTFKQLVCIMRHRAKLTSRRHVTERYVVLPHKYLFNEFPSVQGDAQRN